MYFLFFSFFLGVGTVPGVQGQKRHVLPGGVQRLPANGTTGLDSQGLHEYTIFHARGKPSFPFLTVPGSGLARHFSA